MKKVTQLLLVLLLFSVANAQKVYFIYIQSENDQPFYARMGEKIYNSSATGYLILSKMRDSSYSMNIGIHGSQTPEQLFLINMNSKDRGFLLKNFGEKGWGLFNLQSLAVIMPAPVTQISSVKTEKREINAFTDLLAKAADDSTLKEKPVVAKVEKPKTEEPVQLQEKKEDQKREIKDTVVLKAEEKRNAEISSIKNEGSTKIQKDTLEEKAVAIKSAEIPGEKMKDSKAEINQLPPIKPEEKMADSSFPNLTRKTEEVVEPELYKKSHVIKRSESSTTEGFGLTFLDMYGDGKTDTIRMLIPADKPMLIASEFRKEEKKFLDIIIQDTVPAKIPVEQKETVTERRDKIDTAGKTVSPNNTCLQTATDEDFFNLRKKMAGENGNENMINEARKVFGLKCFTTEQIRNLGVLFLTDEGKYKFYDVSYEYVSDSKNFSLLQSELKDDYYINRFKAMIRN